MSCSAAYSLTNTWAGGFQAQIVLTNTGQQRDQPVDADLDVPRRPEDHAACGRPAITQSGESVTAANESYNATIAPGGSVTIGFTGTYTSSDAAPTSFAVNGTACST